MRRRVARRSPTVVRVIPYEPVHPRTPETLGALALKPSQAPATGPPRITRRPPLSKQAPQTGAPTPRAEGPTAGAGRGGGVLWPVRAEDLQADVDLRVAAGGIVRLVAEVLAGARPVRQLGRRATIEVCEGVAPHARPVSAGAPMRPPRVLTSWVQEPTPGVAETGAVIALAGRVQALAMRLELHRGRWRCTALETTAPVR